MEYSFLGVHETSSDADIEYAVKHLRSKHHPELHTNKSEEEQFDHARQFALVEEAHVRIKNHKTVSACIEQLSRSKPSINVREFNIILDQLKQHRQHN
jgi:DnaJ-class molecular chaperone